MHDWNSLSHVRWECKYHVVIVPKYRKKSLYGGIEEASWGDHPRAMPAERCPNRQFMIARI